MKFNVQKWYQQNKGNLLFGMGVGGVLLSFLLAYQQGVKIGKLYVNGNFTSKKDEAIAIAKNMAVPVGVLVLSLVGINIPYWQLLKKNAFLTAALTSAVATADKYKDVIEDKLSPEKAKEIKKEVTESMMKANPMRDGNSVVIDENGDWVYEPALGLYIKIDRIKIAKAFATMNENRGEFVSFRDYLYYIGLDKLFDGPIFENVGWDLTDYDKHGIVYSFDATLKDGVPVYALEYDRLHTECATILVS